MTTTNSTAEFSTAMLWSMAAKQLVQPPLKISDYRPLVQQMFPGINYYSVTGFNQAYHEVAAPAVAKMYPGLKACNTQAEAEAQFGATLPVAPVMPSAGYEWQNSAQWRRKFDQHLQA
jgi:hypothetical protein